MTEDKSPRAIHLAAGEGTRLHPLTDDCPKPLIELAGTTLLEYNVRTLRGTGIENHIVITGYKAEDINTVAADLDIETVYDDLYDETEIIYSLFTAAESFPEENEGELVISYADIIYESSVVEALLDCDEPVSIIVDRQWRRLWDERFEDPLDDAETIKVDDSGRILSIGNTPNSYDEIDAQYIGLLKVRNDYISDFIDAYRNLDAQTDGYVSIDATAFLQWLIDQGWHLQAVPIDGGWIEIDTISDLKLYRRLHDEGALSRFVCLWL